MWKKYKKKKSQLHPIQIGYIQEIEKVNLFNKKERKNGPIIEAQNQINPISCRIEPKSYSLISARYTL